MDLKKEATEKIKKYPVLSTIIAAGLVLGSLTTIANALDVDFRFWVSQNEKDQIVKQIEQVQIVGYVNRVCQIKYRLEDIDRKINNNRVFAQQQKLKGLPPNFHVEDQYQRLQNDKRHYLQILGQLPANVRNQRCP